jgi:hypothetical protein
MMSYVVSADLLQRLYEAEKSVSGFLAPLGVQFSPVAVSGGIADPGIYNLPSVMPATTEAATYSAAGTPVSDTYTGVSLWNLLNDAGGVSVTAAKNDILSKYVVATGADGYKAVFSLGEIDPEFGGQPVLAAYADTAGQLGPQGSDGLARMVVPRDQAGGRYVSDLVDLQVGSLPEPAPSGPGGISDQFTLSGQVAHPAIFTPIILAALDQPTIETATYLSGAGQVTDTYTGVSLWTLIQDGGLLTDPSVKNDLLRYGVVATGSDGYRAVISLGEIDPAFGNQPDIVAYADSQGQLGPNGADGLTRVVLPNDHAGGRYVSNLVNLQVIDLASLHPALT